MSIRPVSRCFPTSQDVWEDTNLPMCVVVTPLCADVHDDDDDDDDDELEDGGAPLTVNGTMPDPPVDDDDDDDDADDMAAQPLSSIPKCLNCGAPHPPSSLGLTHLRPARSTILFCMLCGKTSSTLFTDQESARRLDEYLDIDMYDLSFRSGSSSSRRSSGGGGGGGGTSSAKSRRSGLASRRRDPSNQFLQDASSRKTSDAVDFRLPLEVFHHHQDDDDDDDDTATAAESKTTRKNKKKKNQPPAKPPKPSITWQFPALLCPPIWWIVLDGTVSSSSSTTYWQTVSTTLQDALADIPPHVHVGLLTCTSTKLASWDLTSSVPHVQQYPFEYQSIGTTTTTTTSTKEKGGKKKKTKDVSLKESSGGGGAWDDLCLVPASGAFKDNLQAALRAMGDAAATSGIFLDNGGVEEKKYDNDNDDEDQDGPGMALSQTLEVLLEFMSGAHHPGQDEVLEVELDEEEDVEAAANGNLPQLDHLRYAGGRILCLLGNPPMELEAPHQDSMALVGQAHFYDGGVAGACFAQDNEDRWSISGRKKQGKKKKVEEKKGLRRLFGRKKKDDDNDEDTETDPTDLTPNNLKDYVVPLEPENLFATIGKRCAQAALGVDLLVVVPELEEETSDAAPMDISWYGLPLLRILSDTSGAPGPLMFGSSQPDVLQRLGENILARTPWQAGMVFGAKLRLRISPGFELEDSPVEEKRRTKLQLAPMLSSGGIMGPAFVSDDPMADGGIGSPDESGLWVLGTCDPYTSLTVDLQAAKKIEETYNFDGFGEVTVKPVIQTCLLYTCIETDDSDDEKYYTVCKMRVSSVSVPLADEVEPIFDSLDPEALAAVLYHKIALDAYLEGFVSAQKTAETWLRGLLVSVYQSAQLEQAKIEELATKKGKAARMHDVDSNFIASERLLDQEGDMEIEDVLLGQGHAKIAVIPLLVFALIQCDALRPTSGNFQPSMDARLCALAQLASMTPSVLAKSIAPSLSVWSLKDDEAIVESLPLSVQGILTALEEVSIDVEKDTDTVLVLDSPRQVMLYRASRLKDGAVKRGNPKSPSKQAAMKVKPNLEETLRACILGGFRTAPLGWSELEDLLGGKDHALLSFEALNATMLEDKPTTGGAQDFADWKIQMAALVKEDLVKSGDLVDE